MHERDDSIPSKALEDVAYLSRSHNRVRILDALTRRPYSRRDLAERTETSRTTLDRIVNELEERGWAQRTNDGDYAGTPAGTHLVEQMRPFIDSVEAIRRLEETVAWLPADELTVGLHHFSDADVLRPKHDDPMETVDYITDLIRDTSELRVLTHLTPPVPNSLAIRECTTGARMTFECVLTDELVEYLRDQPERRNRWQDIIEGGADVFRSQDPIPCNLLLFDDTVLIKKSGPEGIQDTYGVPIRSESEAVQSWAHDLIDRWRADATRVDIEVFAGEPAVARAESDE